MPAKWQQWMPFKIDAFKGSPAVQAMHPCARIGYLYLLSYAWQADDCTIPDDQIELAEKSGLGDELWAVYGPRILRKFDHIEGSRLRNQVLFEEWEKARGVYEKRAGAADKTNSLRSPHGHRTVTDGKSNGHRTPTDYDHVYVGVSVPVLVPVEGITPEMMARGLAERLGLSLGYGANSFNTAVTEVAENERKAGRNLEDVCTEMEASYRFYLQEKPTLDIHWGPAKFFGEGHWRDPTGWKRRAKDRKSEREAKREAFLNAPTEDGS